MTFKKYLFYLILFVYVIVVNSVSAASKNRTPYISYLYPAGGQAGTEFELIIGGQFINQTKFVQFNTPKITVESVTVIPRTRGLNGYDRKAFINRLITRFGGEVPDKRKIPRVDKKGVKVDLDIPKEFLSERLKEYSPFYLTYLLRELKLRKSPSQALDTRLLVKLKIAKDLTPGKYYLQLKNSDLNFKFQKNKAKNYRKLNKNVASNKIMFVVDNVNEINELTQTYQINTKSFNLDRKLELIDKNSVVNGRIIDGEVDEYKFSAKQGEKVALKVMARELMPFIGDGVPGWFQPVIGVKDMLTQKELAFADDFQNNPDPTLIFTAPYDGDFIVYIRDAIYRGREDFVYRLKIGKFAVVDGIYPRGGYQFDSNSTLNLEGIFLAKKTVEIDNEKLHEGINVINVAGNEIKFHISKYFNVDAKNSNLTFTNAYKVNFPVAIDGRIATKRHHHFYKFFGEKGQDICLDAFAKRLNSPLDSVLRIYDKNGDIIAMNDDFKRANIGLNTHHSDSFIELKLPYSGDYYIEIFDVAKAGGKNYSYRLELKPKIYDFDAIINSAYHVAVAETNLPFTINFRHYFADSKGKYFEVRPKNKDIKIHANKIEVGVKERTLTISIPQKFARKKMLLDFEVNLFNENGKKLASKDVIIGQKMMQAFIWYHWLPIGEFSVNVLPKRGGYPLLSWQRSSVIFSKNSNEATLMIKNKAKKFTSKKVFFVIEDGPKGIKIKNSKILNDGDIQLTLEANKDFDRKAKFHKNIIVSVNRHITYYRPIRKSKKKEENSKSSANDNEAKNQNSQGKSEVGKTTKKEKVEATQRIYVLEALEVK
ncbi:hypothetical protein AAEX28_05860 [Lentisphaerota bacterium WC36G]|nr:hypothetical protein LJT99_08720 [Lentisphaerae bacterium WC36]